MYTHVLGKRKSLKTLQRAGHRSLECCLPKKNKDKVLINQLASSYFILWLTSFKFHVQAHVLSGRSAFYFQICINISVIKIIIPTCILSQTVIVIAGLLAVSLSKITPVRYGYILWSIFSQWKRTCIGLIKYKFTSISNLFLNLWGTQLCDTLPFERATGRPVLTHLSRHLMASFQVLEEMHEYLAPRGTFRL